MVLGIGCCLGANFEKKMVLYEQEEVAKPEGEEVQETGKEECIGEIHSPLKADENESDEDDPHRWDEYKFDF